MLLISLTGANLSFFRRYSFKAVPLAMSIVGVMNALMDGRVTDIRYSAMAFSRVTDRTFKQMRLQYTATVELQTAKTVVSIITVMAMSFLFLEPGGRPHLLR